QAPIQEWIVGLSPGFSPRLWTSNYGVLEGGPGDFDGNGKTDLWRRIPQSSTYYINLSNGAGFQYTSSFTMSWCGSGSAGIGDFNGDGKYDFWCNTSGSIAVVL